MARARKYTPEESLSCYRQEAHKFPMLTCEEELDLARRWRNNQDVAARDELVTSHFRLVISVAVGYRGYGLPISDLVSQGNVGLMQAVECFDPDKGFRFATHAMWWIRAAIQEYAMRNWSLVKIGTTAAQKKLFFNLRHIKSKMRVLDDGDLSPEQVAEIARSLGVPEQEVVNMNRRLAVPHYSLNTPAYSDGEEEQQDFLVDGSQPPDEVIDHHDTLLERRALLAIALKGLNDRERDILIARRLQDVPPKLEDLAGQYNISRERVRQIEMHAFEKLQKAIKAAARERKLGTLGRRLITKAA